MEEKLPIRIFSFTALITVPGPKIETNLPNIILPIHIISEILQPSLTVSKLQLDLKIKQGYSGFILSFITLKLISDLLSMIMRFLYRNNSLFINNFIVIY